MADPKQAKTGGLTTGKAIVIAVLALTLVGVVYWQFGTSGATAAYTKPGGSHRRTAAVPVKSVAATTTVAKKNQAENAPLAEMPAVVDATKWKSPPLTEVVAFDPLAVPETFPKPKPMEKNGKGGGLVAAAEADDAKKMAEAVAQLQMQLRELEQRGVQVIVRERDQYAAMIGDRVVHVGDEIDGFTVTVIDPTSGVRVERKSTQ
jgi:hypothetical protein